MAKAATKARVLVVDDHPLMRVGLIHLINRQSDLTCCGEAGTVVEAQAAAARLKPDLVLLDLRLKWADGLELIKSLKSQFARLRILVLSQRNNRFNIYHLLTAYLCVLCTLCGS